MSEFNPYNDEQSYETRSSEGGSNVLGIVGFILSLSCILSPIGLLLSLIALFKAPRGFAIAGVVIGLLFTALWGLGAMGLAGLSQYAATATVMAETAVEQEIIDDQVNKYVSETGSLPSSLDAVNLHPALRADAWDTPYRFLSFDDGSWDVVSAGPDGVFDTPDDFSILGIDDDDSVDEVMIEGWQTAAEQGNAPARGFWESITQAVPEVVRWYEQNENQPAALDTDE